MAALGLMIGSFLNVCILRLPSGGSVARPASGCPRCGRLLAWYDTVPVISFLVLRARCRACQMPISWQYPIIELTTGALYVALTLKFGFGWLLYSRVILVSLMIVMFMISLRHRNLPSSLTTGGIVVGLFFSVFTDPGWLASLHGAALGGGGVFVIARAASRVWGKDLLPWSDMTIVAVVGAFFGWQVMLVTTAMSALVAAVIGRSAIAVKPPTARFSTYLAAASIALACTGVWAR